MIALLVGALSMANAVSNDVVAKVLFLVSGLGVVRRVGAPSLHAPDFAFKTAPPPHTHTNSRI